MSTAGEGRERVELEDFEVPEGQHFNPVQWLNRRLAKNAVSFERLDQHLLQLGMSCQLLCQDTSDSIELASNQLISQLPSTGRDLERMHQETLRGRSRLSTVLEGLREADDRKRSGLQGLSRTDAVKTRVQTAYSALREVGSWDRKVRDCDQMVHSHNLPAALSQLSSLKGVLDAFSMLPEYAKKEEQLGQLEESLLATARRRTRLAFERNSAVDFHACSAVFVGLGRAGEPAEMTKAVFLELVDKAWQNQDQRGPTSTAAATGAVLEALAQACEERWPLLQALDQPATEEAPANVPTASEVLVVAVGASLGFLSAKLEACLAGDMTGGPEEASAHARATRAVALLAAYVDGLAKLATCKALAGGLWPEVCCGSSEVLPWSLLREIAQHVVWRSMLDDAQALVPPVHAHLRPSEAVLAAESNAKRLLQMPASWAKRLETQGAAQLAVLWLACLDETCAWYWKQWDPLIETFENTLQLKRPKEGDAGPAELVCDFALLNECMQLHSMLHGSIPIQFTAFQAEVLQLASRMLASPDLSPFAQAMLAKLRAPDTWCDRFAVPSPGSLRAAHGTLEGVAPDSPAFRARMDRVLPLALTALEAAEKKVRGLVGKCCVQPVAVVLGTYSEMPLWFQAADPQEAPLMPSSLLPLPAVTAVGEHLFSLVPVLEQPQGDGAQVVHWLPMILESVVDVAVQKVLQIRQLSNKGAKQLAVDLEYLQKVTDALGSGEGSQVAVGPAKRLGELLDAVNHLATQSLRQKECLAQGEDFREEPREGPPLERRAERALRAALGLAS